MYVPILEIVKIQLNLKYNIYKQSTTIHQEIK